MLRNLVDEEGIDSPDRKPHSQLWMDFANGMGASDSAVRQRALQPETQALIGTFFQADSTGKRRRGPGRALRV